MGRRRLSAFAPVSDDVPHPRTVFEYLGDSAPETAFVDAMERGRLHHAWLLTGPEGVGKATFAYRAARRLLGAAKRPDQGPLGADADDPVCRQIVARAHPDLLVLQREVEDGKPRRGIPVDEARELPEFFAKSPATAPYRVAIIDAADDLNVNAANAVLKTLEEPPARGVVLLISHAPGGLLATIRSRCRTLRFSPPPPETAAAWVMARADVTRDDALRLLSMARGAPGQALRLAAAKALEVDAAAGALLDSLPKTDDAALLALADSFRGATGMAKFQLFFDRLAERVQSRASRGVMAGQGVSPARWAEAWSELVDLPRQAEAVNLDRPDVLYTAVARLKALA